MTGSALMGDQCFPPGSHKPGILNFARQFYLNHIDGNQTQRVIKGLLKERDRPKGIVSNSETIRNDSMAQSL